MGIAAPPICQDLPDADPDSFEPKAPGDGDGNPGSGSDSDSSSSSEDPYSNKAQLYKYFSGKGPTKMVATFLQDERLKLICIIICLLSEPLEEAYAKNQETMQSGPQEGMAWAAERAAGSWWSIVIEILKSLTSPLLMKRLGFTMPSTRPWTAAEGHKSKVLKEDSPCAFRDFFKRMWREIFQKDKTRFLLCTFCFGMFWTFWIQSNLPNSV